MTAPTFDTRTAVRGLRSTGIEDPLAEGVLVTRDMLTTELSGLRADMYRALWIQGAGIVAVIGGIIGITEVIG